MICIGNQTACWAASPREPFDYAVKNAFDAFEFFPDKKPNGGWDESDLHSEQRRDIRETAVARGIRLSVHARWQANPLQTGAFALFEKDIQLAHDLGAKVLVIHLYHERGIPAFVEAIKPLIQRTAENELQLAIENTPHHSPEDFNELFAQLRRLDSQLAEHVGMCFDLGHANLCAATRNDYLKFLDCLAEHVSICHCHFHENWGDADTHLPLFTGPSARDDSGIRGIIGQLQARHFNGSIIFEQWPQPPSLLNQARDKLFHLFAETPTRAKSQTAAPRPAATLDAFSQKIVEGDQRCRSWREKLDFIRELIAGEAALTSEQLVEVAIYLHFLGTGQIRCVEDGRHFRPAHHAKIALEIQGRLARASTPETAFVIRKILPWLPSSAQEFQRAEPLTRIRDIAHRNDIPSELKREIKTTLQNKLHRCAGPEDLAASAALLERITTPGANYSAEFVTQFKIFHHELQEFFNAHSLEDRLQALLPALNDQCAHLIKNLLAEKSANSPESRLAAFHSLTELRCHLRAETARAPVAEQQSFLLADIVLEDFAFALLSEIGNDFAIASPTWETLLALMNEIVSNLVLSQVEAEEAGAVDAELRAWRCEFNATDREQLLRVKATVGRARRLAENFSDRILSSFPPRAKVLGQALGVAQNAIRIFAEAEIRGHLVFQLSKIASAILRRIRADLQQPAWDIVVSGRATGQVTLAGNLAGNFSSPALVLVKNAEGDEEIPANVAGIVLAHELPHLSHLAVRARQAGVILLACEDTGAFADLKKFEGKTFSLRATTEKVEWHAAENATVKTPRPRTVQIPKARLATNLFLLPLEQATTDCAGAKSDGVRRLTELARKSRADFRVPTAVVIPFGAMESVLRAAPEAEAEYRYILQTMPADADAQLRELILRLDVPQEITAGVTQHFSGQTRLMARSSANDEDLKNLAGAGLYESVANVSPAEIGLAIREVWASLWTRRAILSRQQAGIPHADAHIAVLIQQMLAPDFSFILHTANPINQNRGEVYAEIVVGLGETIASATARGNPYRLVGEKKSGAVATLAFANFSDALWPDPNGGVRRKKNDYSRISLSLNLEAREKLGRRLAEVAKFVETEFGGPQDIEGVVKNDEIFLVQSRPQQGLK